MKWLIRAFRAACVTALVLVMLLYAAVQFQQRLLRWRAEQLMADMHRIRLYQSTWSDAQRLMHRWGKWGHYDGSCTSANCRYQIALSDLSYARFGWIMQHGGFRIYNWCGGRSARLTVSFTVHDGTTWRETAEIGVTASPRPLSGGDGLPVTLIVQTKSRQRLRETEDDWWILGADNQLEEHPYYKAGRPGGCEINCEEAVVTYSTRTSPDEIERLTSFDLSCLDRFNSCTELEQLLPAAREWHLYKDEDLVWKRLQDSMAKPCALPLWAIARDSRYVLAVEGISAQTHHQPAAVLNQPSGNSARGLDFAVEEAQIKIDEVLKGTPPWPPLSVVTAYPYSGYRDDPGTIQQAQHLRPRTRYLVFPVGDDRKDQRLTKDSAVSLDHCGVWSDTPENRRELLKGFSQNDSLRGPELP
jgi:hypothetical protein